MPNPSLLDHAANQVARVVNLVSNASPDVHAALIGNAGLFLGGVLTFFTAAFFAGRQFRHERIEKAKDRALELKKELLVDGIRGAQEIISALNLAADTDRPLGEASEAFQVGSRKLLAAAAVANIDSVSAGRDLIELAGPAMLRIMTKRAPVSSKNDEVVWWQGEINRQDTVILTMIGELRAAAVADDGKRAQTLNALIDAGRKMRATMVEDNQARRDSLTPLRLELGSAALDESLKLNKALELVLAAVRKDIGVDAECDRQQFLRAIQVDIPRMRGQYDAFVAELADSVQKDG